MFRMRLKLRVYGKNTKQNPKKSTLEALNQVSLKNNQMNFYFHNFGGQIPYIPNLKQGE